MGQKVNPRSIRLKINEMWSSRWFGRQNYTDNLITDLKIRGLLLKRLKDASVAEVVINRDANKVTIDIYSGRPGVIIGRGGAGTEELKKLLTDQIKEKIQINIIEIKRPDGDASIIAQNIASQIEKRLPFRRAMKQAVEKAKSAGVKGVKIQISGRLNGADIARSEKLSFGTVPLGTFKSDIDYKYITALTTFGIIGIKVWVYNGEKLLTVEELTK
ncbi:MAG: 30S ribosomal protein S3 [Candidatus Berkelbacteria bacterium]|nr:30S ribosomal protein S3 [Candidatus Berkelbacteria bacterium]